MTNHNTASSAAVILREIIMGFRLTQLIYVAARLNIADHLQNGPLSTDTLANTCGAHAPSLYRLLRALAGLGIFEETDDGCFKLTPLAEPLQTDVSGSLHAMALLYGGDWYYKVYGNLFYSIITGKPAFEQIHQQTFFEYLDEHADTAKIFNQTMTSFSGREITAILNAYDFSHTSAIVDVGGGHGRLIIAILNAARKATGILFDQQKVLDGARKIISGAGLAIRCELIAGDFFDAVPSGGDLYILKSILHDWNDENALAILNNCRTVMTNKAKLLLIERVVPPGNEPSEAKLFDINMLVNLGGCERTELQFKNLLAAGGFKITNIIPAGSPLSIIEAVPVHITAT